MNNLDIKWQKNAHLILNQADATTLELNVDSNKQLYRMSFLGKLIYRFKNWITKNETAKDTAWRVQEAMFTTVCKLKEYMENLQKKPRQELKQWNFYLVPPRNIKYNQGEPLDKLEAGVAGLEKILKGCSSDSNFQESLDNQYFSIQSHAQDITKLFNEISKKNPALQLGKTFISDADDW